MNYGWMDWKLTIWKHKLCMSATQKSNRRSSFYLYIAITIHNIYCCNFYLLLSHYFNPAVLIYKISFTKCQSATSFGIFVFKLPYIRNSTNQCYSSCLNIWTDRITSLKNKDGKSDTTEHIPFTIKTALMLCV